MMGRTWRRNCVGVGGLGVGGLVLVVFIQLSTVGVPAAEGNDAPGASPCWDSPSAEGCEDANVYYPPIEVLADIVAVCTAQPKLSGCSVYNACSSSGASGPFCTKWSILADLCSGGAAATGVATGCRHYTQLCGLGKTSVTQCSDPLLRPIQSLVSAAVAAEDVAAMCDAMSMEDCATCTTALCPDPLLSLGKLCISMPGMTDCLHWKVMCGGDGAEALTAFCGVTSGETCNPVMQMSFHWGLNDMILFAGWVPCTPGYYVLSLIAVAATAVFAALLKALRAREQQRVSLRASGMIRDAESVEGVQSRSEDISAGAGGGKTLGPLFASREVLGENLKGALFVAVTLTLDYLLMLVAMTFNIGGTRTRGKAALALRSATLPAAATP
ncbi:Ctr copper transporter family-domain-containing protein, partial [Baffinella frigidus]